MSPPPPKTTKMTKNSSFLTLTSAKKQKQQEEEPKEAASSASFSSVASLAFPWFGIVLVASVAATVLFVSTTTTTTTTMDSSTSHGDGDESLFSWDRFLQEQTTKQHGNAAAVVVKPIYNEEHDALFPLTNRDYMGFFLAILGLMVAAGGGIGGGGILVPIYILVLGFSPKHAIPLSNITVFGGAMANTVLNISKRHPLADRPLVDWNLILIMEPLTIAGALMGAFLNKVLPEVLLTILLVVLLAFTANTTLRKAFQMYAKESAQMHKTSAAASSLLGDRVATKQSELTKMVHNDEQEDVEEAADALLEHQQGDGNDDDDADDDLKMPSRPLLDKKLQEELDQILYEERSTPVADLMILMTLFVVVLAINVLKGGGAMPSPLGIKCGSQSFWIANALMLAWILVITGFVRQYLVRKWEQKQHCQYPYVEGDIQWNARATILYPIVCCAAGFFAGMFGVGGGIVKGPLMLAMGTHPAVAAASSAVMILFTSFTATTSFLVFGLLVMDYAAICLVIGFLATLVGQIGLAYLMKRAQRNSYIAFSIGGVVLLSAFLMTIQSLLSMAAGEKHHAGGICGKGD